jgi:hypothetical protein
VKSELTDTCLEVLERNSTTDRARRCVVTDVHARSG